jgi:predicted aspartyl protease
MIESARTQSRAASVARRLCFCAIAATAAPHLHGEAPSAAVLQREGCQLTKIAEWSVLPGRVQPVVEGRINGRVVGVMLDTGATRTLLTRSMAIQLGLTREATRQSMSVIGGTTAVDTAVAASVEIGDMARKDWSMLVAGDRDFGPIGMVVGEDFLRHADIEFDLAHNAVRLFQARNCDGVSLAYWAPERAGQVALESHSEEPVITFKVEINGRALDGQLDSGAERSMLRLWRAAVLGAKRNGPGVVAAGCIAGAGSASTPIWYGPFDSFAIGDERIRNPILHFADFPPSYRAEMLLGADFLRAHRVLVAHSQRRMYFTYVGGTVFPAGPAGHCPSDLQPAKQGPAAPSPN